jgi:Flp pilus assembly pilin Flp
MPKRNETGASLVEYAMIVALVTVVLVTVVRTLGPPVTDRFNQPVTVLGETKEKPGENPEEKPEETPDLDCVGKDHAHKGCKAK